MSRGKNNHVSQSTEQRQLPRVLSSPAFPRGERSYLSRAKKRGTFALYSEQGRPKRAVATAVVGAFSKPQSEACFRQKVTVILFSIQDFPSISIGSIQAGSLKPCGLAPPEQMLRILPTPTSASSLVLSSSASGDLI